MQYTKKVYMNELKLFDVLRNNNLIITQQSIHI